MEKNYINSDCNFTSVSQRKPNRSPSHPISMPVFPKINLINTNWQETTSRTGVILPTFENNLQTNQCDKNLMPPPDLLPNKQNKIENVEIEFKSWKPYINSKLNISIKGFISNNILEHHGRSIVERISNIKLKDSKGVIYILNGPCVGEELPEYIKTKFQDGFPKDWQAVKEIWIDFIKQHKSLSFRWPRQISDDNDDIVSGFDLSNASDKVSESVLSVQSNDNEENPEASENMTNKNDFNIKILSDVQLVKPRLAQEVSNDVTVGHNKQEVNKKSLKIFIHDLITKISEYMSDDETILITKSSSFISKSVQTSPCQNKQPEHNKENSNDHDDQTTNANKSTNGNHSANLIRSCPSSPEYMGVPSRTNFTLHELKRPKSHMSYKEFKRQKLSKTCSKSSNNTQSHTHETQNIEQVRSNLDIVNSNDNDVDSSMASYVTRVNKNEQNLNCKKTVNSLPNQIESDEYTTFSRQLTNCNIPLQQKRSNTLNLNETNKLPRESTPILHHNNKNKNTDIPKLIKKNDKNTHVKNVKPIENNDSRKYDNTTDNDLDVLLVNDKQSEPSNRTIILGNTILFQSNQTRKEQTTSVNVKENEKTVEIRSAPPAMVNGKLPVSKRGRILSKPLEYWKGEKLSQIIKNGTNEMKAKCSKSGSADSLKPKRQTKSTKMRDDNRTVATKLTSSGKRKLFSHNFDEDDESQWNVVAKRTNVQDSDFSYVTDL